MSDETTSDAGTNEGTTLREIDPETGQPTKRVNFFPAFPTLMSEITLDLPVDKMAADAVALAGGQENYEGGFTTYFSQSEISNRLGVPELKDAIYNVSMAWADQNKWEVARESIRIQVWVSVIHAKGFHGIHNHPKSHLSGTFYAQVPTNGSPIIFMNPTQVYRMNEPVIRPEDMQEFNAPEMPIVPKPNQMFCWPSWLSHHVPSSMDKAEGLRVAYSFNVTFEEPTQTK